MITIPFLAAADYPALARFRNLKQIDFYEPKGTGADDARLQALAKVNLPRLADLNLLNCPSVTDKGIEALADIKSLDALQLEGTSITDAALDVMASKMRVKGVNVANCSGVTAKGLGRLLESEALVELSFSTENVTQAQVVDLIKQFKSIRHCEIVDTAGKLEADAVKRAADGKGVKLLVRREGALQTMKSIR